jgi:hypothetical protein
VNQMSRLAMAAELFSGVPLPKNATCGWQERQDALHKRPGKPMPGPWGWEIHDHSMASLYGGGEDSIIAHILSVSPCKACQERADPKEWKWGRCMTPNEQEARLIAAVPAFMFLYGMLTPLQRERLLKQAPVWVRKSVKSALKKRRH